MFDYERTAHSNHLHERERLKENINFKRRRRNLSIAFQGLGIICVGEAFITKLLGFQGIFLILTAQTILWISQLSDNLESQQCVGTKKLGIIGWE